MEGPTPGLCRGQHNDESRWSCSKSRNNVCKRKVQLDYAAANAVCLLHLDNAKASCIVCCNTTCALDSMLWRNFSQKAAALLLIAPWRQAGIFGLYSPHGAAVPVGGGRATDAAPVEPQHAGQPADRRQGPRHGRAAGHGPCSALRQPRASRRLSRRCRGCRNRCRR